MSAAALLQCSYCHTIRPRLCVPAKQVYMRQCTHVICTECYRNNFNGHMRCGTCFNHCEWIESPALGAIAESLTRACSVCQEHVPMFSRHTETTCLQRPALCDACTWRGVEADREAHVATCAYVREKCSHCENLFHRGALAAHVAACEYAKVQCSCGSTVATWELGGAHKC